MYNLEQLKQKRPTHAEIEVEEWGGLVRMERVTAREQLELNSLFDSLNDEDTRTTGVVAIIELLSRSVVDADGERIFGTEEGRDFLAREPLVLLSRVGDAAMDLHDLGSVEEQPLDAKKND